MEVSMREKLIIRILITVAIVLAKQENTELMNELKALNSHISVNLK